MLQLWRLTQLEDMKKLKRVLEDMHASPSRLLPIGVDLFEHVIEKPVARQAFGSSFKNSTTTQIKPEGIKTNHDIQCLVLWEERIISYPSDTVIDLERGFLGLNMK